MRPILKNIIILIIVVLVASSSIAVMVSEPKCGKIPSIERYEVEGEYEEEEEDEGDNGNGSIEEFPWDSTHFVFIEEATGKDCIPCLPIAEKLYELYKSGKYPFYYISCIMEQDNIAEYVKKQYNYFAYPSVYIDGGYKTIFGGGEESVANIEKFIKDSLTRDFSSIYINVSAEWDKNNSEINIDGKIKNDGNSVYKGKLRIFLAEIITTEWVDASKKPFHFGAHSIITNEDVEIPSKELKNFSKTIDSSDLDPENFVIFAAIYNSKTVKRDSDPNNMDRNADHEFDAHFTDNVAAAEVVEGGNLPPFVEITIPEFNHLHISGKPRFEFILLFQKKTFTIGKIDIKVNVTDEEGIDRVEFFLDNESIFTDEDEPFEYTIDKIGSFRTILPRKHNIKVVAVDTEGKENSANIDVFTILI
ncbi:hypothetical protein AYK21_03060 [Thermoplasmatales archaeon SG8-52-2]|nr:MAG: hypothetical protein AYK21_03060 [Thermoplasmatales archaeon SG8-52-2]